MHDIMLVLLSMHDIMLSMLVRYARCTHARYHA